MGEQKEKHDRKNWKTQPKILRLINREAQVSVIELINPGETGGGRGADLTKGCHYCKICRLSRIRQ